MPTDARPRQTASRVTDRHHITVGRYHDASGEHTVALTRDPDAGGPWRLTDTTCITEFAAEETAAEALATANMYLREHGGKS